MLKRLLYVVVLVAGLVASALAGQKTYVQSWQETTGPRMLQVANDYNGTIWVNPSWDPSHTAVLTWDVWSETYVDPATGEELEDYGDGSGWATILGGPVGMQVVSADP